MEKTFKNELEVKSFFADEVKSNLLIKRGAIVVGGIVILGLMSTILINALMAGLALATLVGVGVATTIGGMIVYKSIPVWITKLENKIIEQKHQAVLKHLESMKGIAKKNPIEQMELTYKANDEKIKILFNSIVDLKTAIDAQKRNVKDHKKKNPNFDSSEEDEQLRKLELFMNFKEQGLNEARADLNLYKEKMETVKFKWEFKNTSNKALDAMDRLKDEDIMRNILTEVAIEEVSKSMDNVMARVDVEMNQVILNNYSKPDTGKLSHDKYADIEEVEVFKKETTNG